MGGAGGRRRDTVLEERQGVELCLRKNLVHIEPTSCQCLTPLTPLTPLTCSPHSVVAIKEPHVSYRSHRARLLSLSSSLFLHLPLFSYLLTTPIHHPVMTIKRLHVSHRTHHTGLRAELRGSSLKLLQAWRGTFTTSISRDDVILLGKEKREGEGD